MTEMQRLCAEAGCHRQRGGGGENGWVVRGSFGDERGETHFLEHIEVIVRGRSIGADAHIESIRQHLLDRRKTRSQFEV